MSKNMENNDLSMSEIVFLLTSRLVYVMLFLSVNRYLERKIYKNDWIKKNRLIGDLTLFGGKKCSI